MTDESSKSGFDAYLPIGVVTASIVFAYFSNLREMVGIWNAMPDYSHGYLVVPIAIGMLWLRRDRMPEIKSQPNQIAMGLAVVGGAVLIRILAARYFLTPVENWTIPIILLGFSIAWVGWRVAVWASPAIGFLVFAMPLPFTVEIALRQPLRGFATEMSSRALIMFGYPAIAEGNTLRINDSVFGVSEACSGLRIFWGIAAFAFAIAIVSRGPMLVRGLLLVSIVPVAIFANSSRIVLTCLAYYQLNDAAMRKVVHDGAGILMIPYAILLLVCVLVILRKMFFEVEVTETVLAMAGKKKA